ncbi:hypothetical protein [Robertmurraya korlensis]|uniref:hypothetical protein n=1 Tax=Robertmurraya korlensis TaxID=519977 RepID=UPI0008248EB7|nr:hypothetical protein [Robertmurraya korlensis]
MRKGFFVCLVILAAIGLSRWALASDWEFGTFDDFEEALQKGIPHQVNHIVHKENYDGVTIVMYTTFPDQEELPLADYEALAVAFFKGNDKEGWESIGQHGWSHYENENMTLYSEALRDYDHKGNTLHDFYVVFGEINNPNIVTVETKTHEEETFEEAKIISSNGLRYYFQIGREMIVRGLSGNGEVLDRQGG